MRQIYSHVTIESNCTRHVSRCLNEFSSSTFHPYAQRPQINHYDREHKEHRVRPDSIHWDKSLVQLLTLESRREGLNRDTVLRQVKSRSHHARDMRLQNTPSLEFNARTRCIPRRICLISLAPFLDYTCFSPAEVVISVWEAMNKKTKHLLLELMPDPVLVFGLDEEVEVIQVLDDESGTFTLVHGKQDLLDG
jgi:hypothetical protein